MMRKESLENLTPTGHTEGERNRRQQVTYLTSFHKWVANQGQRCMVKNRKVICLNKRQEVVMGHGRSHSERSWYIKDEETKA